MSKRSLIQLVAGMAFALAVLTACGDGNGVHFTVGGGNWPWPWPHKAEFFVNKTFSENVRVADHTSLWLDAVNGEIEITGQPGADSVMVTGNLRVGSDSYEDAQQGLDQLDFSVMDGYDEISVQTLQPKDTKGRQYIVNYTITVPRDLAVDVNHVNGHLTVKDIENSIIVDVENGNVNFSNIFGDATVSVDNGSVDGTMILPPDGEIRLSTVNGDLDLRIPTSTSAELSAFVDNGTITRDNLELMDALHTNRSLTGTLGDGAGVIRLETTNGNIDVTGFDG